MYSILLWIIGGLAIAHAVDAISRKRRERREVEQILEYSPRYSGSSSWGAFAVSDDYVKGPPPAHYSNDHFPPKQRSFASRIFGGKF